jgi:DNA-binding transcriptional ArsR family regulator
VVKMDSDNLDANVKLLEILMDPVRAQIYFEAMMQEEITAKGLMNRLTINRSTLTHHLVKMVEVGIFDVRVQSVGRPIKYYRISEFLSKKIVIEKPSDKQLSEQKLRERIMYLETALAHLQVINNTTQRITKELINELKETSQDRETKKKLQLMSYSFLLVTKKEAEALGKKYMSFQEELQSYLKNIRSKKEKISPRYLMFSGLIPIIRND